MVKLASAKIMYYSRATPAVRMLLVLTVLVLSNPSVYPAQVPCVDVAKLVQERGCPGILPRPDVLERYAALGLAYPEVKDWPAPLPSTPVTGTRNILFILIDFADKPAAQTHTQAYYQSLLFGNSPGSLKHYVSEVSYGLFTITGSVTATWVRSGHDMVWWGEDGGGIDSKNSQIFDLVREAIVLADASVDFSVYDTNHNDVIERDELSICIVHAGSGQEATGVSTNIWSHHAAILGQGFAKYPAGEYSDTKVDNRRISRHTDEDLVGNYWLVAEDSDLGTFAHEFAHDLGLPDLYDTDMSSCGVGDWCLMSSGSKLPWTGASSPVGSSPAHPSGWCKAALGWNVPMQIGSGSDIPVNQIETTRSQSLYKLPLTEKEYFLIENRQKTGYDGYLPGSGILIWHIDESVGNNNNENNRMVDLEEAHGGVQHLHTKQALNILKNLKGNWGDANDTFYSPVKTSFTDQTDPNSKTKAGYPSGFEVVNIGPSGTTMKMTVNNVMNFDFSLNNSGPISVMQGDSGFNTISVFLIRGTSQTVAFSASGLPIGSIVSLSPSTGRPSLHGKCTVSTSSSTPPGSYTITVTCTSATVTRTTAFTLTVYLIFDFSLSNSGTISTMQGGSGSNTVTATFLGGTTQEVTLSESQLPVGASLSFSLDSGNPTFTSTCTISTSLSTPVGSYWVTVTGTGGGLTRTTSFQLTVYPSGFARVSSITFTQTQEPHRPMSGVIDPLGQYAYFGLVGGAGAAGAIVKIRLSDFTCESSLTTADGPCVAAMMDPGGQYAYFAYAWGNVSKIRLSDFKRLAAIALGQTIHSAVIDPSGQYAYLGVYSTAPYVVVKIRLSDMTQIGAVTLNADESDAKAAIIDPSGKYAYFGTCTEKGKIVRIRLSDFTRYDAIALPSGWGYLQSAAIDPSGKYSYWTCGNVFKVNLETFTLAGSLNPLSPPYLAYGPVVIDRLGQYAYIGTHTHPGTVVKISLSSFTKVGEITLRSGEDNLACAVMDPNGQYAYFGTEWDPGIVVKIRVASSTFDFSLSNSGEIKVTRGGSGSNTITVTLLSGTAETVALSLSGLPPGASALFSSASSTPTYTSTLTINTSSITPGGSYTMSVTGTGGGYTHTTTFTLTVPSPVAPFGQETASLFGDTSSTLGFMVTGNIYDDSGILGIYAHRSPPRILFPKTDTSKVLSTGQPTWSGYAHLVTVGGRIASPTTRYYEDIGLAPLKWAGTTTEAMITRGGEVKLSVSLSSLGSTNDYFVMQVATDGSHKVIILWGITQYGTYASGIYFDGIFPTLSTLSQGWYIIRWQDLNSNGIVDYPTEFTIHSSGS